MAAAETVWAGSAKTRTELARKKSCALEVAVTLITELSPCHILDKYNLRNAFPPQEGKLLLQLQWPVEFKLMLRGVEGGMDPQSRTLLLSLTGPTGTRSPPSS
eukprot:5807753-Pyramimonas_sp.AAC.1